MENLKSQDEATESIEVTSNEILTIEEVISTLKPVKNFTIQEVINTENGYNINGEFVGNKADLTEFLQKTEVFGITSYSISIENNNIKLSLMMLEIRNNNCI